MEVLRLHHFVFAIGLLASCHALAAGEPEPGLWELSADLAVPSEPGFKQEPVKMNQCLGAAEVRDPGRLLMSIANPGAGNCSFSDKRESPGHTEFTLKCSGLFAISGRGSVDYTPNSMQGRLNIGFSISSEGASPRVESVSQIRGKRIGGC